MRLDTPEAEMGWQAVPFSLPDPNGNTIRFDDLLSERGLVVAFICNHCPYVKAIADRLAADAKRLRAEGIELVAINANDYDAHPADRPEKMLEFASEHGFDFPYLVDKDQSVARAWGAVCTPDFFGLNGDGRLQYRGRLDDARMDKTATRTPELVDAMRSIAATGQGPETQHPSMGCSIKWR